MVVATQTGRTGILAAERVTAHSMRAGGATDYLSWGMSGAFVQKQGGWLSDAYMIYYRPSTAEGAQLAATMKRAAAVTKLVWEEEEVAECEDWEDEGFGRNPGSRCA